MSLYETSEFFKSSCQKTADYPRIPVGDAADFAYWDLFFTSVDFESLYIKFEENFYQKTINDNIHRPSETYCLQEKFKNNVHIVLMKIKIVCRRAYGFQNLVGIAVFSIGWA